ncbi:MAG: DUF5777 family beta-barrel protein [Crocinitomicaceae bacterium]|nr:DUF5777 family beta-barrel protein [Crocinitomicaceae bacterium]
MKTTLLLSIVLSLSLGYSFGQDEFEEPEEETEEFIESVFSSTRVINGHSTETLEKNVLEFRVEHRFGDVAGPNGGAQTMFGFDNVADIRLGFEFGITDNIMIGIGRSKGTGAPYRSLIDGLVKYRFLRQKEHGMPVSMALLGTVGFTYMKASEDLTQVSSFPNWQHRFGYSAQLNISRKFWSWLSLQISPTMVHRNYVAADDVNTLFALGGAARFSITKKVGIIVEYFHAFHDPSLRTQNKNSLGIAVEFETFGHNFTINFTNSKGFGDMQYIPHTYEDWLKGQFRLGFTMGRKFSF